MAAPTSTSHVVKRAKRLFSSEEKDVLLEAYQKGMISASHPLVDKTAHELQLDKKRIKTWVNNQNRLVQGRARSRKKVQFKRGQSSYNIYMEGKHVDHNSPESSLAAHAKMWRALPPQTKEEYRKEAEARKANGPPPPANEQERQKRIKHLMKRMNPVISQLKKLGMEVCGHAFGRDFFASFGTNSGRSFAESNALQHKLLMFMDSEKIPEKEVADLTILRKEVRAILNEAFSKCIGKRNSRVPYQSILNGYQYGVRMPEGIPFKDPQALSIAALRTIKNQGVTFFRLPEPESHPDVDNASPGHSSINENDIPDARSSPGLDAEDLEEQHDHMEVDQGPSATTVLAGTQKESGSSNPSRRKSLGQHKRRHSPDRPLRDIKFIQYKRIHIDENSFPCGSCTKLFRTASALTKHKETHRAEKPVKCEPSKTKIYWFSYLTGRKSLRPILPPKDPHSPQPKQ